MEKKQGFFSALKDEVVRGLSPAKSRGRSPSPSGSGLLRRRKGNQAPQPEVYISRSGSLRPCVETLSPLMEGPDPNGSEVGDSKSDRWWMKGQLCRAPSVSTSGSGLQRSDLRLLLGVLGAPLAPVHVSNNDPLPHLSIKDTPISLYVGIILLDRVGRRIEDYYIKLAIHIEVQNQEWAPFGDLLFIIFVFLWAGIGYLDVSPYWYFNWWTIKETSSAQYILQQYTAASGGQKLQNTMYNAYAMGKVRMMASDIETATKVIKNRNSSKTAESGGFVLWQMNPDMWYVELALGSSKVHAGCNGKLVWRHTPWLGAHAAKGPVRPLRRALQGLDPRTTANMFASAKCTGEKKINGEDCFILKLCADPHTLKARSEGPAEIIRHVLFGYFSQKTGLLVHLEDSHLTRIQTNGGDAVYWETTINSFLDDYRPVEGIMIAHSGRSVVTLFRFGETAMSHTKTRMEEAWTIEEVAFNVPGLSEECFIPPAELRFSSIGEACELSQGERVKTTVSAAAAAAYRAKVAALDKSRDGGNVNNIVLKMNY
ncbi:hypothetical protein H5410_024291 [Solanum commersonii]|uniref:Uncharacterized protein n=2 Tax=Solanum TaxID=4107 RepID=A0A9J5ZLK3_SOLCO|nr:hypothetical protein H5410_024291 [Solanum commersonii]